MTQDNARGMNQPITVGGDLSGKLNNATVVKLQGNSVDTTAPSDGQILTWSSGISKWTPVTETVVPVNITLITSGSNYTVLSTDTAIVNLQSANSNVNLPATATQGRTLFIGSNTVGSFDLTVVPFAGTTLNGGGSITFPNGTQLICYDGTNWMTVGAYP